MRTCVKCHKDKPESEFHYYEVSERWTKMCQRCRDRNAQKQEEWRLRNPEEAKERGTASAQKWRKEHPERLAVYQKRYLGSLTGDERRAFWTARDKRYTAKLKSDGRYKAYARRRQDTATERMHRMKREEPEKYAVHLAKARKNHVAYIAKLKKDPVEYEAHMEKVRANKKVYMAKLKKDPIRYAAFLERRRKSRAARNA